MRLVDALGRSSLNGKPLPDAAAGNAALTDLLEVCALCNDARITYNEVRPRVVGSQTREQAFTSPTARIHHPRFSDYWRVRERRRADRGRAARAR